MNISIILLVRARAKKDLVKFGNLQFLPEKSGNMKICEFLKSYLSGMFLHNF